MLFQITHTHTTENCPAQSPDKAKRLGEWWQSMKTTSGVKILAGYVSPIDHTLHITVEAEDFPTLARALGPLNTLGSGQVSPILPLDQATPMAEAGDFRMR